MCARKTQSLHLYYVFITPPGKWEKIQLKLKTKRYAYLAELSLVQLWQSLPVWFFCWFIHNMSGPFSAWFFSRLLVSRFLLPAVSCPQTENTRSTYASDAGLDSTSWASGANRRYLLAFRDPELKSIVFWVVLALGRISNQFSVHSVDACFRRHLKTVLFAQQRRHHSV